MDAFRRNYGVYYSVLCFTGLWPYEVSTLSKIQRVVVSMLTLCCIAVQIFSLTHVEITLHNLLTMLSYTGPMLLFFLRYVGFVVNFPVVRSFLQNMENDCKMLENPHEMKILLKHIEKSKFLVFIFLGMSFLGICAVVFLILLPTLLHFKYQLRILQLIGFFYNEHNNKTDLVSLHVCITTVLGLLTVACTEASLAVFACYLSGLFEIVGYRIRCTVEKAARLVTLDPINIGPAVDMHQRAYELVPLRTRGCNIYSYIVLLLHYVYYVSHDFPLRNVTGTLWILNKRLTTALGKNVIISYLLAILAVVGSFAVNLYRVFLSIMEDYTLDEIAVPVLVTSIHLLIMFLNNYSGQSVINTSSDVFIETYNSVWYLIPPSSQKMLLLVLVNSLNGVKINLAGLFVPCYEGFSMMMSSSFSYFTVLYSV
ncbi:uncharacterized protein LOC143361046 isoform X1 [Halictus rubicundus]|uniref:uncharacterized protein LOC143361046 isoform X1 n=1 Tax=Halictus rubicundus TaxID=77578 RepID=UPI0040355318